MFFFQVMLMAIRGLRANLLRSMLAVIGVIIGVAAVICAMSILEGARKDIVERVESMGSETITVIPAVAKSGGRNVGTVQTLTVDEDTLRAQEGADFPPNVPEDAREGTRRNMLGASLLNAERYPGIGLQSENLQRVGDSVVAQVRVIVRNHASSLRVPVSYELRGNVLRVQGDIAVRQTDLGLTPFSLFGGALRVEDEMRVRFRIVARAESAP